MRRQIKIKKKPRMRVFLSPITLYYNDMKDISLLDVEMTSFGGDWGFHSFFAKYFTVVHIPSGRAVTRVESKREAKLACKYLTDLVERKWNPEGKKDSTRFPIKFIKEIRDVLREKGIPVRIDRDYWKNMRKGEDIPY
jgi:hypothetical protein